MRLRSALLPLAFALPVYMALSTEAHAQSDADRATARSLGQEGQQAFESKDYATAEDRFRRADKMVHAPTLVLGLARSLAAEGKYVEAQESYNRIIREGLPPGAPDVFKRALDDAKKEVDAVSTKVGSVTITVKAAGGADIPDPQVTLDDHPINSASLGVKRAIDPGAHVLRATAEGYKPGELKFSTTEAGSADEPLTLEKDLSAPPPVAAAPGTAAPVALSSANVPPVETSKGRKLAPWIAFGAGGVGLVVGGIGGILALSKHSTLKDECTPNCPPSAKDDLSAYHTVGLVSDIGFIVAAVGGATGAILLLTQPKNEPTTGVTIVPTVGLGTVGATGRF